MLPRPAIEAFDQHLAARGLRLEAIVIGGAALGLLGVIERQTRDFDVLAPQLPAEISSAARVFAGEQRRRGVGLIDDWLNNGPMQLVEVLSEGWRLRVQPLFKGAALVLDTLGPADLLKTKLFASDCLAVAPTADALAEALPWVALQDANPDWPAHVEATLDDLKRRLGHGV